jgi:hypothetical protein
MMYETHVYLYIRVQRFLKLTMLYEVLDRQKISKTALEKAVFVAFLSFFSFCVKNLKTGPSERKFFCFK